MIMETIIITGLNVVLHYIELTVVEQGQVGDYMLIEDLRLAHPHVYRFMNIRVNPGDKIRVYLYDGHDHLEKEESEVIHCLYAGDDFQDLDREYANLAIIKRIKVKNKI